MQSVEEIYLADPRTVEMRPFLDRVLELVRLFHHAPVVRIRILGAIAAGEPIEALEGPDEEIELRDPDAMARRHTAIHDLRRYLCPMLQGISSDAFEIARVITPLLVGLKLSGKLTIDLNPWIFAGIALLIERMGVAAFCADCQADDVDEEAPRQEDTHLAPHESARQSGRQRREGKPRRHRGRTPT